MSGFEVVIPYIMAASSVYALGKGISDENWLQAAAGAFGMYSAMGNLGTAAGSTAGANTGVSGAATQQLSTQASETAIAEGSFAGNLSAASGMGADALGNLGETFTAGAAPATATLASQSLGVLGGAQDPLASTMQLPGTSPSVDTGFLNSAVDKTQELLGKFYDSATNTVKEYFTPGSQQITDMNLEKIAPMVMKGVGMYQSQKAAQEQADFVKERYDIADRRYEESRNNQNTWVDNSATNPFRQRNKQQLGIA